MLLLVIGAGIYGSGINKRTDHNDVKDGTTGAGVVSTDAASTAASWSTPGSSSMPMQLSTPIPSDVIPATKQPSGTKTPDKAGAPGKQKSIKAKKAGMTATQKPAAPNRKKSTSSKTDSSNQKSFAGKLPKATKESFAGQLP